MYKYKQYKNNMLVLIKVISVLLKFVDNIYYNSVESAILATKEKTPTSSRASG